jgi:hypothetical protein
MPDGRRASGGLFQAAGSKGRGSRRLRCHPTGNFRGTGACGYDGPPGNRHAGPAGSDERFGIGLHQPGHSHVLPGNGDSVHIVGVSAPFTGRTKEGLGIGDSRATVIQVYGQPTDVMSLKPGYDVIKYKSLGLNFEFYEDKVNMIATVFPGQ